MGCVYKNDGYNLSEAVSLLHRGPDDVRVPTMENENVAISSLRIFPIVVYRPMNAMSRGLFAAWRRTSSCETFGGMHFQVEVFRDHFVDPSFRGNRSPIHRTNPPGLSA
jgi:hypothetical protein